MSGGVYPYCYVERFSTICWKHPLKRWKTGHTSGFSTLSTGFSTSSKENLSFSKRYSHLNVPHIILRVLSNFGILKAISLKKIVWFYQCRFPNTKGKYQYSSSWSTMKFKLISLRIKVGLPLPLECWGNDANRAQKIGSDQFENSLDFWKPAKFQPARRASNKAKGKFRLKKIKIWSSSFFDKATKWIVC